MSDLLVLCYHAVSDRWPSPLAVSAEALGRQVAGLLGRGYTPATFTDAVASRTAGRTLAVTFDDAYRSVIVQASPVLADLGVPATVYAPSGWVGAERPMSWPGIDEWAGTPHEDELVPMGWDELGRLRELGWEVGSHTVRHPHLTQLGDEELGAELGDSRRAIEDSLGAACPSIAYPYGDVDARVAAAARAAGYRTGAALPERPGGGEGPLDVPRIGVYPADDGGRFRVKTSPAVRRLRRAVGR